MMGVLQHLLLSQECLIQCINPNAAPLNHTILEANGGTETRLLLNRPYGCLLPVVRWIDTGVFVPVE